MELSMFSFLNPTRVKVTLLATLLSGGLPGAGSVPNKVDESDESNNTLLSRIEVDEAKPDLAVDGMSAYRLPGRWGVDDRSPH
jgi:hypothetical protein